MSWVRVNTNCLAPRQIPLFIMNGKDHYERTSTHTHTAPNILEALTNNFLTKEKTRVFNK